MTTLTPVIDVDAGKCVNCHACIAACPVKFAIDGSGDTVEIIPVYEELAIRIEFFGDEIDRISTLHPLTGDVIAHEYGHGFVVTAAEDVFLAEFHLVLLSDGRGS